LLQVEVRVKGMIHQGRVIRMTNKVEMELVRTSSQAKTISREGVITVEKVNIMKGVLRAKVIPRRIVWRI